MLEINQVACFIAIVEEGSFSRAANTLGIAQSVASQRLRRLEDLLGVPLLERTSRTVRLSQSGLEFLPFARQLLAVESRARAEGKRLSDRARRTIRLGGYAFSSHRRARLIEHYIACNPSSRVEVEYACRDLLIEMLRKDQIDAFLCLADPEGPMVEFAAIPCSEIHPHISFLSDSIVLGESMVSLADLRGMQLAITPGRHEPQVMKHLTTVAKEYDIALLEAAEAERSYVAKFAAARGLPILHWLQEDEKAFTFPGFRTVPLDEPRLQLRYYLYTNPNVSRPAVDSLRSIASGS